MQVAVAKVQGGRYLGLNAAALSMRDIAAAASSSPRSHPGAPDSIRSRASLGRGELPALETVGEEQDSAMHPGIGSPRESETGSDAWDSPGIGDGQLWGEGAGVDLTETDRPAGAPSATAVQHAVVAAAALAAA